MQNLSELTRRLVEARVEFVLIGGFAGGFDRACNYSPFPWSRHFRTAVSSFRAELPGIVAKDPLNGLAVVEIPALAIHDRQDIQGVFRAGNALPPPDRRPGGFCPPAPVKKPGDLRH